MDEPVDPWVGAMQSRYVDELTDLDGDGYGVLFETAPLTPAFGDRLRQLARGRPHSCSGCRSCSDSLGVAMIVRDRDPGGTVKIGRDGEPVVGYLLSAHDTEHLMQGFEGAARIAEAAGATRSTSPHHRTVGYEPGKRGSLDDVRGRPARGGHGPGRLALAALHIMGSGPDGRLAGDLRGQPGRPDLGRAGPRTSPTRPASRPRPGSTR